MKTYQTQRSTIPSTPCNYKLNSKQTDCKLQQLLKNISSCYKQNFNLGSQVFYGKYSVLITIYYRIRYTEVLDCIYWLLYYVDDSCFLLIELRFRWFLWPRAQSVSWLCRGVRKFISFGQSGKGNISFTLKVSYLSKS